MRFLVLGPLEVSQEGRRVAVGGGRERSLLALLLIRAGEVVSRERLIEELWAGRPPPSASQSLDAYVSRLRRAFREAGASDVLVTRAPGYVLTAEGTDARDFESLVADARVTLSAGNAARGVELLRAALALWRGSPYAEIAGEPWARAECGRLEELRVAATEDRIEAELALGYHAALVGELEVLAARHPERERAVGQLMLALYRSGRQAEALAVYRAARRAMVEELGLEPGRDLHQLESAVLTQDPSLDLPRAAQATTPAAVRGRRASLGLAIGGAVVILGFAATALIASGGGRATRRTIDADAAGALNPTTGSVSVSVPVGSAPAGIANAGGSVWITNGADGTVSRIGAAAGHVDQTVAVGSSPSGIAASAGSIWVANALDGTVSRIDPRLAQVVQTIRAGRRPTAIAVGGGAVWVADADGDAVIALDARTGSVRAPLPLADSPRGVAYGLGAVWVTEPLAHQLLRIDPHDRSTLAVIGVGGGAGPVAVGGHAVWVVNTLDGTVSRIDPDRNDVSATVPLGEAPSGVAASARGVWVSEQGRGELVLLDPRTGAVRRRYRVGAAPAAVTLVGRIPWVAAGAPAGRAHRGGILRVRYSPFTALDPAEPSAVHPAIWAAIGDGLVAFVEDSGAAQIVPDLATAVPESTEGGLTYTFRLRPGLRYSTGQPVRASDVRRELERLYTLHSQLAANFSRLRGAARCARTPSGCDLSRGVVTDDRDGTVTFHLGRPDPELLFKLAAPAARPVPPGTPRTHPSLQPVASTGPYRAAVLDPGRRLLLVRNARFREWSRAAQPDGYPDRIDIRMDADPNARVRAVLRGAADEALEVASAHLAPLRIRFAAQLHIHSQPHTSFLNFNVHRPPFDDVRARRALNLAFDRTRLARRLGGPELAIPTCQLLPRHFPGHENYCPWTSGSPDGRWHGPALHRARALVRATGTRGATVRFPIRPDDQIGTTAAPVLAAALRAIGYQPRIEVMANPPNFFQRIASVRNPWNISDGDWVADYPSPAQFLSFVACSSYRPTDPARTTNSGGYCNARLDRLVARAEALQLTDPAAAQAIWARADRRAVDDAPWVPLVSNSSVEFLSRRVGHFTLDPTSQPEIDQLWVR